MWHGSVHLMSHKPWESLSQKDMGSECSWDWQARHGGPRVHAIVLSNWEAEAGGVWYQPRVYMEFIPARATW